MHRHIQGRVYQKIYAGVLEEDALVVSPTIIRGVKIETNINKVLGEDAKELITCRLRPLRGHFIADVL